MTRSSFFCDKLRVSSLFRLYQQAFELVTGNSLVLHHEAGAGVSIPVPVGKTEPCFLSTEWVSPSQLGILKSFAMQLGDEANRAVLSSHGALPQAVRRAEQYIQEHLSEKIQLEKVAEKAGICSFQLCRLFKKEVGMTMTEYVNRLRVEKAKRCLEDPTLRVFEISSQAGFTSLSQFNRNFQKYLGESPSEYRERFEQLEYCKFAPL